MKIARDRWMGRIAALTAGATKAPTASTSPAAAKTVLPAVQLAALGSSALEVELAADMRAAADSGVDSVASSSVRTLTVQPVAEVLSRRGVGSLRVSRAGGHG